MSDIDQQEQYEEALPPITSTWAIVSLICGMAGITCVMPGIGAVLAVVFGFIALAEIRRQPEEKSGRGLAIGGLITGFVGLFIGAAIVALVVVVSVKGLGPLGAHARIGSIIEKELKYYDSKMQYLGNYLAKTSPDSSYLLITNQKSEYNDKRYQVLMNALNQAGLNIAHTHEVVAPEEMDELAEADLFLTAKSFDEIIGKYPDVDVVISTLGLPMDYRDMQIWNVEKWKKAHDGKAPPKLVLVDAYVYDLKQAIKAGLIMAVVQYRPDAVYEPNEEVPGNVDEAFNKRYILITPDNVDEMAAKYDGLFMDQ